MDDAAVEDSKEWVPSEAAVGVALCAGPSVLVDKLSVPVGAEGSTESVLVRAEGSTDSVADAISVGVVAELSVVGSDAVC